MKTEVRNERNTYLSPKIKICKIDGLSLLNESSAGIDEVSDGGTTAKKAVETDADSYETPATTGKNNSLWYDDDENN